MEDFKAVKNCRVCGSGNLKKYLDLGEAPLANSLLESPDSPSKKYPVEVLFCERCSLSQLSVVVNPEILYRNYPYHSSVSKTFKNHCFEMAKSLKNMFTVSDPLVVDIASNDGCLLEQFKTCGYQVIGIEPSKNLAEEARRRGIETINDFWSEESSNEVIGADLITATNVFAHVDDLRSFLGGVRKALDADGIFVLEVPYLFDLISKNQFDTIYHEHLSYFLLRPLSLLFSLCGLPIFHVELKEIHGGSLRVYASCNNRKEEPSVGAFESLESKTGLYDFDTYQGFSSKVKELKKKLVSTLEFSKSQNLKLAAYGAAAKGISLLNYCGIDRNLISYIADDTPEKQGKFAPGCLIPIVGPERFLTDRPDDILILPWNFKDELIRKTKHIGSRYIMPIPEVKILGHYNNMVRDDLNIEGDRIESLKRFYDERGSTLVHLEKVKCVIVSTNKHKGTIRGMHWQEGQEKIVRCSRGKIFDVVIDMRKDSPAYLKWKGIQMSEDSEFSRHVPSGCAHGYQTLEDDTEVTYLINTDAYEPRGVLWNDPELTIRWPLEATLISDQDKQWEPLSMVLA